VSAAWPAYIFASTEMKWMLLDELPIRFIEDPAVVGQEVCQQLTLTNKPESLVEPDQSSDDSLVKFFHYALRVA